MDIHVVREDEERAIADGVDPLEDALIDVGGALAAGEVDHADMRQHLVEHRPPEDRARQRIADVAVEVLIVNEAAIEARVRPHQNVFATKPPDA